MSFQSLPQPENPTSSPTIANQVRPCWAAGAVCTVYQLLFPANSQTRTIMLPVTAHQRRQVHTQCNEREADQLSNAWGGITGIHTKEVINTHPTKHMYGPFKRQGSTGTEIITSKYIPTQGGVMAELIKCLSHKPEDLHLDPQHSHKSRVLLNNPLGHCKDLSLEMV